MRDTHLKSWIMYWARENAEFRSCLSNVSRLSAEQTV